MAVRIVSEPLISVGIVEEQNLEGRLNGVFSIDGAGTVSGEFSVASQAGRIVLRDGEGHEAARTGALRIEGGANTTFDLFRVTIGKSFHWERKEDHSYRGNLVLLAGKEDEVSAVNELPVEDYLESVVASEMSAQAPIEFLKCHAILSRSWALAILAKKGRPRKVAASPPPAQGDTEIVRWYDGEDHELFDVCADDHCQRYHGLTKITSDNVRDAVRETRGVALTFAGEICDARYSKACGGRTAEFRTAWADVHVPYLVSIYDGPGTAYAPIATEEQAERWIDARPDVYCNTTDEELLANILPDFDRETTSFFRWTVEYTRSELEEIIREKSGLDFGALRKIEPLERGPSGRIRKLMISGSKMAVVVGKELEIRRWLSPSHLYSSAFMVRALPAGRMPERFVFEGAGWGHGVGLCQIGAAVMASRGFSAEQIMAHYFRGATLSRLY